MSNARVKIFWSLLALAGTLQGCLDSSFAPAASTSSVASVGGEGGNSSTTVTIDWPSYTPAPATPVIIITSSTNNNWINSANVSSYLVSGTCTETDMTKVISAPITIKLNATVVGTTTCISGAFSMNVNAGFVADGTSYPLTATITDLNLVTAVSSGNVVIADLSNPVLVITGTNINPINAAGTANYTLTFSDPGAPLGVPSATQATVQSAITVGGTSPGCVATANCTGTSCSVAITGCTGNGTASISLATNAYKDLASNPLFSASVSSTFTVNNTPPSIAITSSTNGNILNASNYLGYIVSGTCTETSPSEVNGRSVTIKINGFTVTPTATCSSGSFSTSVNTTSIADGSSLNLTATITDLSGNTTVSSPVVVSKNTSFPSMVITSSTNGGLINSVNAGAYTVSGTCIEPNPAQVSGQMVTIKINGTPVGTSVCSTGAFSIVANAVSITDGGPYPLTATMTDVSGNTSTTGGNTVVKYTAPPQIFSGTGGGFSYATSPSSPSTFTNKTILQGLGSNTINAVFATGTSLYAATTAGLSIAAIGSPGAWTNYTTTNGLGSNTVNGVFVTPTNIYAAAGMGISIAPVNSPATFTNYATTATVLGVYVTATNIYAATMAGLAIAPVGTPGSFTYYTSINGIGTNTVRSVYVTASSIYLGTTGGLSVAAVGTPGTFTNYTIGLGNIQVNSVFATASNVYAATNGGGISISAVATPGTLTGYTTGLGSTYTYNVFVNASNIFVSTAGGVSIAPVGSPSSFTNYASGLGSTTVYASCVF